jgi:hypothetical protein
MPNIIKLKNYLPLPPGPPLFVVEKEKFTPIVQEDQSLKEKCHFD